MEQAFAILALILIAALIFVPLWLFVLFVWWAIEAIRGHGPHR